MGNSTRVDEGRKRLNLLTIKMQRTNLLTIKMQRTNRSGNGGEKSLPCDPGSELRLGGIEKKKGEDNKWDGKKRAYQYVRTHKFWWGTTTYQLHIAAPEGSNRAQQYQHPAERYMVHVHIVRTGARSLDSSPRPPW